VLLHNHGHYKKNPATNGPVFREKVSIAAAGRLQPFQVVLLH